MRRPPHTAPIPASGFERTRAFGDLLKSYNEHGLVLAVGAGLSLGSRLPGWDELLRRLAKELWGARGAATVNKLRRRGHSLPAIAGMLSADVPEREFTDLLRNQLYREFPYYREGVSSKNRSRFIDFVEQNSTLAAVARLCVLRRGRGFVRNPDVHAVVNFNFDGVFRQYVGTKFGPGIVRTIERASADTIRNWIPVYHMHGYLRFDQKSFWRVDKETPDVRVFTEHEYFDFFNRPTAVYTYTFLHLLREHPVLFVGLSLLDDNIRRLLHYSLTERVDSYQREGLDSGRALERSRRHFALHQRSEGGAVAEEADSRFEEALLRLGVRVIWFQRFEQIAPILGSLSGASAARGARAARGPREDKLPNTGRRLR